MQFVIFFQIMPENMVPYFYTVILINAPKYLKMGLMVRASNMSKCHYTTAASPWPSDIQGIIPVHAFATFVRSKYLFMLHVRVIRQQYKLTMNTFLYHGKCISKHNTLRFIVRQDGIFQYISLMMVSNEWILKLFLSRKVEFGKFSTKGKVRNICLIK